MVKPWFNLSLSVPGAQVWNDCVSLPVILNCAIGGAGSLPDTDGLFSDHNEIILFWTRAPPHADRAGGNKLLLLCEQGKPVCFLIS